MTALTPVICPKDNGLFLHWRSCSQHGPRCCCSMSQLEGLTTRPRHGWSPSWLTWQQPGMRSSWPPTMLNWQQRLPRGWLSWQMDRLLPMAAQLMCCQHHRCSHRKSQRCWLLSSG